MERKSERKRNFYPSEKEYLKELVRERAAVIESKETDAVVIKLKSKAWDEVTTAFNSAHDVSEPATTKQLKKLWTNMKARARDAFRKEHARSMMDSEDEDPLGVIQNSLPTASSNDCDDYFEPEADNDSSWQRKTATTPTAKDDTPSYIITIPPATAPTDTAIPSQASTRKTMRRQVKSIEALKREIIINDLRHQKIMNARADEHDTFVKKIETERVRLMLEEQKWKTALAKAKYFQIASVEE